MTTAAAEPASAPAETSDLTAYVQPVSDGRQRLHLMVEGVHCGGCVQRVERALLADPAVEHARLNLSTRRLLVEWRGPPALAGRLASALGQLGYPAVPYDPEQLGTGDALAERRLLRAMAVAGFAAGNVMLLSIAVWAGHFQDMGPATRGLLHWFSALIALPAIVYAGRPFYHSALSALRHGRTNMDVPIALAIVLASAMSLVETARGGAHVYFDSAIMLLFFLLIGRYLDRRARGRARGAAERLLALDRSAVTVLDADGRSRVLPAGEIALGMTVLVTAGERIGIDGRVCAGHSDVDFSLISGETTPTSVGPGDTVFAGTINQGAALRIEVTAVGERTLLAEIVRLMELAEQRRARFVVLADRVARLYAPLVHALALATFLGWTLGVGIAWQVALLHAVAVLIITCPCALGLAVPAVQVIASGRLLRQGVLLKSATALERLATVDTVVLDKTGTLTRGRLELDRAALDRAGPARQSALAAAARLAGASRHPLARALAGAMPGTPVAEGVEELPGRGLRLATAAGEIRLGSRSFAGIEAPDGSASGPELWLARPGEAPARFTFTDELRTDAAGMVAALHRRGLRVELLSGDRAAVVERVAAAAGIAAWSAECPPAAKVRRLEALAAAGQRVLMVGDGLNDAPALAAAHVSLSPASAIDISRVAADAIFQGERLQPVVDLLDTAGRTARLIKQNLALALAYNVITVPLAVLGMVTPLIAALAMSASSLAVVGNALRLGLVARSRAHPEGGQPVAQGVRRGWT